MLTRYPAIAALNELGVISSCILAFSIALKYRELRWVRAHRELQHLFVLFGLLVQLRGDALLRFEEPAVVLGAIRC